jgi:hypothetical protein
MKIITVYAFLLFFPASVFAQDDLMKILEEETPKQSEKVIATFKTTRIINAQSLETVKARSLDFRIAHRFGSIGDTLTGGFHSLFGLDNSADIRIAFEYGITDRLTLGFSRSKRRENLEGLIKFRLLEQTTDNSTPIAVTLFSNAAFTPEKDVNGYYSNSLHRLSYTFQAIIGSKITSGFSLQVMPTLVHRNYVENFYDQNNLVSVGIGGRLKLTRSLGIIGDYFYNFNKEKYRDTTYYFPLGLGFELETGGHVFTIMFSNSAGLIENDFLPYTRESWLDGGYKFSFNISRVFTFPKRNTK